MIFPISQAADGNLVTLKFTRATARFVEGKGKIVRCEPEQLCDVSMEFPAINYKEFNTKKYRYFYGVSLTNEGTGVEKVSRF